MGIFLQEIQIKAFTDWTTLLSLSSIILLSVIICPKAQAHTQTFHSGSFIKNMGVTPQTTGNGSELYGISYDLMPDHGVPIKSIINPGKSKDGVDFFCHEVDFRGVPFNIGSENNTPVDARIACWQFQGKNNFL